MDFFQSLIIIAVLLHCVNPQCIFPYFANGKRFTTCSLDGFCSVTRFFSGKKLPCLAQNDTELVAKKLRMYRPILITTCGELREWDQDNFDRHLIRIKHQPGVRLVRAGMFEIFRPPNQDQFSLVCFHLNMPGKSVEVTVQKVPFSVHRRAPTLTVTLVPGDDLQCDPDAPIDDDEDIADGLPYLIGEKDDTLRYTFDMIHPMRWIVKDLPGGGSWIIHCKLGLDVLYTHNVTVIGYPTKVFIHPYVPEELRLDDSTTFRCAPENPDYLFPTTAVFVHVSGANMFRFSGNKITLNRSLATYHWTEIGHYQCRLHTLEFYMVLNFSVRITTIVSRIKPDLCLLWRSSGLHDYNCSVVSRHMTGRVQMVFEVIRNTTETEHSCQPSKAENGVSKDETDNPFGNVMPTERTATVKVDPRTFSEGLLRCRAREDHPQVKDFFWTQLRIFTADLGRIEITGSLYQTKGNKDDPIVCDFIKQPKYAEMDLEVQVTVRQVGGPKNLFKIQSERFLIPYETGEDAGEYECTATTHQGKMVAGRTSFSAWFTDTPSLQVEPVLEKYYLVLGKPWPVRCFIAPDKYRNASRAEIHWAMINSDGNITNEIYNEWLVQIPRTQDVQSGEMKAKCSVDSLANVKPIVIQIIIFPQPKLTVIPTRIQFWDSNDSLNFTCDVTDPNAEFANSSALAQFRHIRGLRNAAIYRETMLTQSTGKSGIGLYSCDYHTLGYEFRFIFPLVTHLFPGFVLDNYFSFGVPANLGQQMRARLKYPLPLLGRISCGYRAARSRVLAIHSETELGHRYANLTICSTYLCEYSSRSLPSIERFSKICILSG
ncbi:hypothetical protein FGIG_07131 [Fasciola gigantica]|uniref:Ig-like domain-containing protein n=1 Tax=Fasciola gigantica TaxID=46835 RepID=A0A504Z338_FASGI|nr:hypothetical protein FGIG_07131 [Fasciola gigantica]